MDLQNLTEQLEKSRHELRKLASELVMAEERERKRIAGVLHDEIAQTLAAARMRLDLLQSMPSDQKDKQTLQEVKAFLVQSIQETRALMNDLGNPLLFDLGLKAACEALANRLMERHPVRIRCDIRDAYKHLDPDVKAILYQVVRELLNNVVKHSQARNARVLIDMENGHFRVQVTDDGVGFDPQDARGAHRRRRVRTLQHPGAADCHRRKPPDRIRSGGRHGGDGHPACHIGLITTTLEAQGWEETA